MPAAMFGDVVVSAQRRKVMFGCWTTIGDRMTVVEVAIDGGHAASGEDTCPVVSFDVATHCRGRPT